MPVQNKSTLKNKTSEVTVVPPPAKDLLVWEAASRPYKKRDREYFTTIAAVVFLLVVILVFLKEWLLIGVIIAFMFFSYVLATVPPQQETYKITSRGIKVGDKTYYWEQFIRFWFSKKFNSQVLNIETRLTFPKHVQLVLGNIKEEKVKGILEKYLIFEKPQKSFVDKSADWLQKTFPLESK
ncbi:hypothetical protein ACFLZ1_00285 [Patescibacteria group bacterium]